MEKVITERDVISKLRKEFRMLARQVENTNLMLGRPTSIRQTAYPYVLCDEMTSFLISENLSADELAVLYDVPCLLEKIIYRHYHVSFVKQRQTGISSQKFIIERGCLKRIMKYDYSHTSPRLNTLISFLEDLGAVSGRRISPLGEAILTTCKHEN